MKAFFLVPFWQKKHFCTKNAGIKCWWNWHQKFLENRQRIHLLLQTVHLRLRDVSHSRLFTLYIQACTTYGLQAKCGPRKLLIWPAKPQILFSLLVSLIKTPLEWVKTYQLWPLDMSKKNFWPAMIFELFTPTLIEQYKLSISPTFWSNFLRREDPKIAKRQWWLM